MLTRKILNFDNSSKLNKIKQNLIKNKSKFIFALMIPIAITINGCSNNPDLKYEEQAYDTPDFLANMQQNPSDVSQADPMSSPNQINTQNGQQTNSQDPAQNQSPDLIQLLAQEYGAISEMFLAKNGQKQYDYFQSKASDLTQNGFIEFELVPGDILKTTKDPRLESIYKKESIVKNIAKNGTDIKMSAKFIATYDCAVVTVIESIATSTPELTSCYDDLNMMSLALAPLEEKKEEEAKTTEISNGKSSTLITIANLKPYTEQVIKIFSVVEFDKGGTSVDISYYDKFKTIADSLKNFSGDYKITIIGYELYDESKTTTVKTKKGKTKVVKKSPKAVNAAIKVNNMLKTRALTVRKMLVSQGISDNNIVIAHPEANKVKYLYNVKDKPRENVLENLIIVDVKLKDSNLFKDSSSEK